MADKMLRIAGRGDDGTAKSIKTDNEGHVKTKEQNILGSELNFTKFDDLLTAGQEIVVIDTTKPSVIDLMEWGIRDKEYGWLKIVIKNSSGQEQNILNLKDDMTGSVNVFYAPRIALQGNPIFEITRYNDTDGVYKFQNKVKLEFPFGFKILVKNGSASASFRNAVTVLWREF